MGQTSAGNRTPDLAASWRGTAFGLRLEAELPVLGLEGGAAPLADPVTRVRRVEHEALGRAWPGEEAKRLVDHRYTDGSVMMTVDLHAELGYLLDAPGHGRFLIAADGSAIDCSPPGEPAWRWHRPFFAQALPIAAGLNRIEVLHASGVVLDGGAVAFVGHSGAGKTSLALHLVDQGAALLADDVVALSAGPDGVLAHPGPRFANVAAEQIETIPAQRRTRFGRVLGRSEKLHVLVSPMAVAPARLRRLYFLERRRSVSELAFERLPSPEPGLLLGATFMTHITAPDRLAAQLEICAALAASTAVFRLRVPPGVDAARLATLVAAHCADPSVSEWSIDPRIRG